MLSIPDAGRVTEMFALLKRNWFFVGLFLVVYLGISFPAVGLAIKPFVSWLIALGMLLIGLRLDFRLVWASFGNYRAMLLMLFLSFVIMPALSFVLGHIFFSEHRELFVGVVLTGVVATTQASSVIWTDIARGNHNLALRFHWLKEQSEPPAR
jgi:predicted Na+-dependent transporter